MQSGVAHTLADLVDLERLQCTCDSPAAVGNVGDVGDVGLAVLDPAGPSSCPPAGRASAESSTARVMTPPRRVTDDAVKGEGGDACRPLSTP